MIAVFSIFSEQYRFSKFKLQRDAAIGKVLVPEVARFWEGVVELNNWNQHRISKLVVKKLFGTISGKHIAILGFAFKANTNDTRESAAITICKDLLEEGAILNIHDPKVDPRQIKIDLEVFWRCGS